MEREITEEDQKLLVECALNDGSFFNRVSSTLRPEYFSEPHKIIVEFIQEYFKEYHSVPTTKIIKAQWGVTYDDTGSLDSSIFNYMVDLADQNAKQRAVTAAIRESLEEIDAGNTTNLVKRMQDALAVGVQRSLGISPFDDPEKLLHDMQASIESRSIGIQGLDLMMDNFRRSELVMFAGGTASGKSLTLANVAHNLCVDGLGVLLLSLELAQDQIAKRLISIYSGFSSKEIFDNASQIAGLMTNMQTTSGKMRIVKIPNGSNAQYIRSMVESYKVQYNKAPDVLVVDYLELMRPIESHKNDAAFEKDKLITEELREVVVDYNMYGFTASQLNRDSVGSEKLTHAHIAGGISKLNTVDGAIGIIAPGDDEVDDGKRLFQQMKIRNGERYSKLVELFLDPKTLRLTEARPSIITSSNVKKRTANPNITR